MHMGLEPHSDRNDATTSEAADQQDWNYVKPTYTRSQRSLNSPGIDCMRWRMHADASACGHFVSERNTIEYLRAPSCSMHMQVQSISLIHMHHTILAEAGGGGATWGLGIAYAPLAGRGQQRTDCRQSLAPGHGPSCTTHTTRPGSRSCSSENIASSVQHHCSAALAG